MKYIALVLAAAFVITACETTTDPSGTVKVLVPAVQGSFVIHANTQLEKDEDSGETVETQQPDDSTVVIGTAQITDDANVTKTAILHAVYVNGVATDTIVIAEEGGKTYLLLELGVDDIADAPINIGDRWVLFGDQNGSSWTSFEENFTGIEIEYEDATLPADVSIKVTGANRGTENITVDGNSVSCVKFDQTVSITMSIAILPPPAPAIEIPIAVTTTTWMGENVGLVQQRQDPTDVNASIAEFSLPGFVSTAIRYGN